MKNSEEDNPAEVKVRPFDDGLYFSWDKIINPH